MKSTFLSPCIKLYGDDFDNIVSTNIYSLDYSTNCDNKILVSKKKKKVDNKILVLKTIKHFNKEDTAKTLVTRPLLSAEKFYIKKYGDFALEILEEKAISLCGQQVKITRAPEVYYSEESSELKTGNLKITMEMFPSCVVDTFNFNILKEREIFYDN